MTTTTNETFSRYSNLAQRVSLALAVGLLVLGMAVAGLRLVGYDYIFTRGSSMEPSFSAGTLLLARSTAPEAIEPGDVVAIPGSGGGAPSIVHRVVVLENADRGAVAWTKGDNNLALDAQPLALDGPVDRVVLTVPYLGWVATPTVGWLLLGLVALLALRKMSAWVADSRPGTVPRAHGV